MPVIVDVYVDKKRIIGDIVNVGPDFVEIIDTYAAPAPDKDEDLDLDQTTPNTAVTLNKLKKIEGEVSIYVTPPEIAIDFVRELSFEAWAMAGVDTDALVQLVLDAQKKT